MTHSTMTKALAAILLCSLFVLAVPALADGGRTAEPGMEQPAARHATALDRSLAAMLDQLQAIVAWLRPGTQAQSKAGDATPVVISNDRGTGVRCTAHADPMGCGD